MRLRYLAILFAFILAAEPPSLESGPQLQLKTKPGVQRWDIKTTATLKKAKVVSFGELIALKDPPGVRKNDTAYQGKRIPAFPNALGVKEGDIVSVTCWLHLVATDPDGDYHMQVSKDSANGDNCLIVEIPKPEPAFVSSDSLRLRFSKIRNWIRANLLHDPMVEPSPKGNVMKHPPLVTVIGQLFYDDSHVGDQPRGKKNMHAATLWELHPLTDIFFAPKPAH